MAEFDIKNLATAFLEAKNEDEKIDMEIYIKGYTELAKFIELLGSVFGFVVKDMRAKLEILTKYLKGEKGDSYTTVQSMVAFETTNEITVKNPNGPSGCRTLLRLHRALDFILHFMGAMGDESDEAKLAGIASKSYQETLAKHHPFLVRKTVGLALYTLPTKGQFVQRMITDEKYPREELDTLLKECVSSGRALHHVVQKLYETNALLDLP